MRPRFHRLSTPLLACAVCTSAHATLVWQETYTNGPGSVTQFDTSGGHNMIGTVTNNQLPITTVDNGSYAYTPDKAGAPLGMTITGDDAFSGLYNFNWSGLNTDDASDIVYEAAGFIGESKVQTRPIMGVILRHWYLPANEVTNGEQPGYYVGLDLAFGSTSAIDFGYNGSTPAIFLGANDPTPTLQLAIGFDPSTNTLSAGLYDASGNLLGNHTAVISRDGGMYGAHPPAYDSDANIQAALDSLSVGYLGWQDYTGNGNDYSTTWNMNSLSFYDDATGAFNAIGGSSSITWNNSGATGDGLTWDTTNQNWSNGAPTVYADGQNVTFNDSNNGHYGVILNTSVSPGSVTFDNSAGDYVLAGSGGIGGAGSLTKSGSGKLTLSTANTYSGGTNVVGGTLIAAVAGALPVHGAMTVGSATSVATVQLSPGIGNVELSALTLNGGSTIDLTNNSMTVDYSGSSPAASIAADLASGYDHGAWDSEGIISSTAAANSGKTTTLGYYDNGSQVLVMYTWVGDTDLNGIVNAHDLSLISGAGNSWQTGDFNYDGTVNADDYSLFFLGLAASGGSSISAVVPEPSGWLAGLMFIGAAGVRRRGRGE